MKPPLLERRAELALVLRSYYDVMRFADTLRLVRPGLDWSGSVLFKTKTRSGEQRGERREERIKTMGK